MLSSGLGGLAGFCGRRGATDSIAGMKIQLLAFASAADLLGAEQLVLELEPGATVAQLRALLASRHPALEPLWPRLAVAVDGELAAPETPLADGIEVALLPPVSGGSGDCDAPGSHLVDGPIDVAAVVDAVTHPSCGAVLLFLGNVRDHHAGRKVAHITYSAYRRMAEDRLARISRELAAGSAQLRVALVHRLGDIPVGEASVAIATASPHRAEAYDASRTALERIKAEVPIWKREHYADGEVAWREEEPLVPAAAPASA